jgi:hypothetical protein
MQLPLYVKIVALIGVALVVFLVAAWELVKEWIPSAARAVVEAFKSRFTRKKPV